MGQINLTGTSLIHDFLQVCVLVSPTLKLGRISPFTLAIIIRADNSSNAGHGYREKSLHFIFLKLPQFERIAH